MKKLKLRLTVLLLAGLCAAVSCSQDPIFYIISKETAPLEPLIQGAPTNMVQIKWNGADIVCVASDRLYWYAKDTDGVARWNLEAYKLPQPGGKIVALAATVSRLYALCMDGSGVTATLRYLDLSQSVEQAQWGEPIEATAAETDGYTRLQSIHADPETERLFVGSSKNDEESASYALLYLDDDDTLKTLKSGTGIFGGTAHREGIHYLCTRSGIFTVSEEDLTAVTQLPNAADAEAEKSLKFMGIKKLEDSTIIVIERANGYLYTVGADGFTQMYYKDTDTKISTGRYATGALALWEDPPSPGQKLLVAGIQGGLYNTSTSSYTYGYVEFELQADGSFDTSQTRHEAGNLLSVSDNDRYTATMGKHPINHLFQAPPVIDDDMTFFASTQTAGLWSYRNRPDNGGEQWNAETK